jgi:general stress protein YciG
MDPEKQRQIASKGGKATQAKGTGHHFDHDEAVAAGRKGGLAVSKKGTGNRFDSGSGRAAARKRQRGS